MTLLSVKALRLYHENGLLEPAAVDPDSGYRRYSASQVPIAQVIRRLRELDMPLDDVRTVASAPDVHTRNAAISAHLFRMEDELATTRKTVTSLRHLLEEPAISAIAVEYRTTGPTPAIAIRAELSAAECFAWRDEAFATLRSSLQTLGVHRSGADGALYSAALLKEEFGEVLAFLPVTSTAEAAGEIESLVLPRCEYAVATHHGAGDELDQTFAALGFVVSQQDQ